MGTKEIFIFSSLFIALSILLGYIINIRDFPNLIKQDVDLAVCILSARNNSDFRNAIRRSWLTDILTQNKKNSAIAKFVVGKMDCPIHPKDRLNIYECQRWEPKIPEKTNEIAVFSLTSSEDKVNCQVVKMYYVKVLHDVILKALGIVEIFPFDNLSSNESIRVVLYDSVTDEEVTSVVFKGVQGISSNGFLYKPVQELHLPKLTRFQDGFYHYEILTLSSIASIPAAGYSRAWIRESEADAA